MRPPPINRLRPLDEVDRALGVVMLCGAAAAILLLCVLIHGCAAPATRQVLAPSPDAVALAESFVVETPRGNLAEPLSLYYLCTNHKSTAVRVMIVVEDARVVVYLRVLTRVPDSFGWTDGPYCYTLVCRDFGEGIGAHFDHPTKPGLTIVELSPDAKELKIQFDGMAFVHEFKLEGTWIE